MKALLDDANYYISVQAEGDTAKETGAFDRLADKQELLVGKFNICNTALLFIAKNINCISQVVLLPLGVSAVNM